MGDILNIKLNIEIPDGIDLTKELFATVKNEVVVQPEPEPPIVVDPPVVTPEPPIITPPVKPKESLLEKLQDGWSEPKEVFDFYPDPNGGCFVTSYENGIYWQFQQDRDGGKIRIFTSKTGDFVDWSTKLNGVIVKDGGDFDGNLQDVKVYDNIAYATVYKDKEIYLAKAKLIDNRINFNVVKHLKFNGAKDTSHSLIKFNNQWFVYGRKRAADWTTTNRDLKDRRGVRILVSDSFEGDYVEKAPLDPAVTQPNYLKNKIKHDYYSARVGEVNGELILGLSVFNKNSDRVPSTRPERTTGTGPILPVLASSKNGTDVELLNHKSPVDTSLHTRRTNWKEAHPYEPEVGQMYCYGIVYNGKKVKLYYSHRFDTHYLVKPSDNRPSVKIFVIEREI